MIEKFMEAMAQNRWIFLYRILGVTLLIIGIATAALGVTSAGFTPVLWTLLGIACFLGVICNSIFRICLTSGDGTLRLSGGGQ